MKKTLFVAALTACLTVLTLLAILSYTEGSPNDIAHDPDASLRQAEAQSAIPPDDSDNQTYDKAWNTFQQVQKEEQEKMEKDGFSSADAKSAADQIARDAFISVGPDKK